MSFIWAMLFALTYSLPISVILILTSGKYGYSKKAKNRGSHNWELKIIGCVLIGICLSFEGFSWMKNTSVLMTYSQLQNFWFFFGRNHIYLSRYAGSIAIFGIGLLINAIYLKGNFDTYVCELE